MMRGMPLETCSAFNQFLNMKFYYKVASCWLFLLIHSTMHGSMNIKSIQKHWNNKFYYTVASCWLFLCDLYYN